MSSSTATRSWPILALAMRDSGRLSNDTVVATVMSNLGFVQAMVREQIAVEQTKVGDRYVLEAMKAGGHKLGGEQSGHVILSDHATTGDGTLTAVMLLARVAQTGKSLADLAAVMTRLPQILVNVPERRQVPGRHRPHRPGSRLGRHRPSGRYRPSPPPPLRHGASGPSHGRGRILGHGRRGGARVGRRRRHRTQALS